MEEKLTFWIGYLGLVFQTTELGWIIWSCKSLVPSPLGSQGNVCGHKSILWSHSCWQLCWDDLVAQIYSINTVVLGSYCVSALTHAGSLTLWLTQENAVSFNSSIKDYVNGHLLHGSLQSYTNWIMCLPDTWTNTSHRNEKVVKAEILSAALKTWAFLFKLSPTARKDEMISIIVCASQLPFIKKTKLLLMHREHGRKVLSSFLRPPTHHRAVT